MLSFNVWRISLDGVELRVRCMEPSGTGVFVVCGQREGRNPLYTDTRDFLAVVCWPTRLAFFVVYIELSAAVSSASLVVPSSG
jgi:hypothetical protein